MFGFPVMFGRMYGRFASPLPAVSFPVPICLRFPTTIHLYATTSTVTSTIHDNTTIVPTTRNACAALSLNAGTERKQRPTSKVTTKASPLSSHDPSDDTTSMNTAYIRSRPVVPPSKPAAAWSASSPGNQKDGKAHSLKSSDTFRPLFLGMRRTGYIQPNTRSADITCFHLSSSMHDGIRGEQWCLVPHVVADAWNR